MGRGPCVRICAAPAFTLLEILITVGLLALLAGIAWPALEKQIQSSHLPESAQRVRSMLFMARCEAVMQQKRFRIRFAPEEQQPLIEYEPDPIRQPGVFQDAKVDWAEDKILLADVQIHEVRLGRPVYLQPLSTTDDPKAVQKAAEEALQKKKERENPVFGLQAGPAADTKIDERRPTITFETDGSAEWFTLVLAHGVLPDEPLQEEAEQYWVVLDGRTGLAFVRGKVTEEQLADPEFYVEREKLEPPDTLNIEDLSFEVSQGPAGTEMDAAAGGQGDTTGLEGLASDLTNTIKDQAGQAADSGQEKGAQDVQSQLEDAMKNTDLTEEEKENMRQGFSPHKTK